MEKKTKNTVTQDVTRVQVSLKDLKAGDKIYIDPSSDDCYEVLDVGNPFILLENSSHFASLYRVVAPIFKDIN